MGEFNLFGELAKTPYIQRMVANMVPVAFNVF